MTTKLLLIKSTAFYLFLPFRDLLLVFLLSIFGITQLWSGVLEFSTQIFALFILFLLFGLNNVSRLKELSTKPLKIKSLLLMIPISLIMKFPAVIGLLFYLISISTGTVPATTTETMETSVDSQYPTLTNDFGLGYTLEYLMVLVSIVIITPILEELFHRGIIFNLLKRRFSVLTSVILSSVLFSLIHGNPILMINSFIHGLIFAYIYHRFGNIIYPIVLHALVNFFPFLVSYILWIFLPR